MFIDVFNTLGFLYVAAIISWNIQLLVIAVIAVIVVNQTAIAIIIVHRIWLRTYSSFLLDIIRNLVLLDIGLLLWLRNLAQFYNWLNYLSITRRSLAWLERTSVWLLYLLWMINVRALSFGWCWMCLLVKQFIRNLDNWTLINIILLIVPTSKSFLACLSSLAVSTISFSCIQLLRILIASLTIKMKYRWSFRSWLRLLWKYSWY